MVEIEELFGVQMPESFPAQVEQEVDGTSRVPAYRGGMHQEQFLPGLFHEFPLGAAED